MNSTDELLIGKDQDKDRRGDIAIDVKETTRKCVKEIMELMKKYPDSEKWVIAARVANSVWAWIYAPTMNEVIKHVSEEMSEETKK